MNRKPFMMLATVTAAAVVLTLMLEQGERQDQVDGQKFLPDLAAQVNDIDRLVQRGADGVVATLSRGDRDWTIEELDGYPADWQKVRATLSALAEANIVEFKTRNPEYFDRLGVAEPGVEGSTSSSVLVASPDRSWNIVAGDIPDMQFGQYVRVSGQDQALLVDQELNLPDKTIDWSDRQILDIGAGLVASVQIRHADGEMVKISKVSADDGDFTLETLPEGRELQSAYTLNSAAGVLAMLELNEVRRDEPGVGSPLAVSEVTLFSELKLIAEIFEMEVPQEDGEGDDPGPERWVRFSVELLDTGHDEAETQKTLEEIQQRTGAWRYRVSSTRMDTLTRRNEDFLKALDDQ